MNKTDILLKMVALCDAQSKLAVAIRKNSGGEAHKLIFEIENQVAELRQMVEQVFPPGELIPFPVISNETRQ